jgi:hypothetical protein
VCPVQRRNWEVVRRIRPCRWVLEDLTGMACGKCGMYHHVRGQGDSRTLCGHACDPDSGWMALEDLHPEDVSAIDRCQVCYQAVAGAVSPKPSW